MSSLVSPLGLSQNTLFWELMHPTIRDDRSNGVFAGIIGTGLENSDPQVGARRRNQLEEAGGSVYNHETLRGRLERIRSLNVKWVRIGEGYSFRHTGVGQYDFRLTERVEQECARLGMTLIDDRLHFGLPDWMHHKNPHQPYFQNPEWPEHFAEFNREVTRRHPTPYITYVNEPLVTALFSSGYGMWNERRKDERSLVNAMVNIAKAMILARQATEAVWKEEGYPGMPVSFQNDSLELFLPADLDDRVARKEANLRSIRRRVILNLAFGHHDPRVRHYLLRFGMQQKDYDWFMENGTMKRVVLGIDHYPACVKTVHGPKKVHNHDFRHRHRLELVIKEYWHYFNDGLRSEDQMPIFHMEVNAPRDQAPRVWRKTYDTMQKMLNEGYPVIGASWFGDEDQVGWNRALCVYPGKRCDIGLFSRGKEQPLSSVFAEHAHQGFRIPDGAIPHDTVFEKVSSE